MTQPAAHVSPAATPMTTRVPSVRPRVALIMAGGTGGHIFPGLALAETLRGAGWQVHWLGAPAGMEAELVPRHGIPLALVDFGGVRGKGLGTLVRLPLRGLKALWQSARVLRRLQPAVVIGLGGYISFPAGLLAGVSGRALLVHEQNAVAGLANRVLARLSRRVFTTFPDVLPRGEWVGNPLRSAFLQQAAPAQRFAGRSGPLRLLVIGGSLGARALNEIVPQALALLPAAQRPQVLHQSGARQIEALRGHYARAGVAAELTPFIEDTACAFAEADLIVARAGASTVTEIAAVGAAALFVPFPAAVDDHQTRNAEFLSRRDAAWLQPQSALSPTWLAQWLQGLNRAELQARASRAHDLKQTQACAHMARACEELIA